jgi:hypothetical protein
MLPQLAVSYLEPLLFILIQMANFSNCCLLIDEQKVERAFVLQETCVLYARV